MPDLHGAIERVALLQNDLRVIQGLTEVRVKDEVTRLR